MSPLSRVRGSTLTVMLCKYPHRMLEFKTGFDLCKHDEGIELIEEHGN